MGSLVEAKIRGEYLEEDIGQLMVSWRYIVVQYGRFIERQTQRSNTMNTTKMRLFRNRVYSN